MVYFVSAKSTTEVARDFAREHEELMTLARDLPGVATALAVQSLVDEAMPQAVMPCVAGFGYATGGNR